MEILLGALLIFVVLAIGFAAIALPFLLLARLITAGPPGPPPTVRHVEWTDDDEIAARHHL